MIFLLKFNDIIVIYNIIIIRKKKIKYNKKAYLVNKIIVAKMPNKYKIFCLELIQVINSIFNLAKIYDTPHNIR